MKKHQNFHLPFIFVLRFLKITNKIKNPEEYGD